MFENKKAQDLSITTIILVILGVVVLVVLIVGFTQGWNSVKVWFVGSSTNMQEIISQCGVACATGDQISWCQKRTLKVEGQDDEIASCEYFATSYADSVQECSALSCKEKYIKAENCPVEVDGKLTKICGKGNLLALRKCEGKAIIRPAAQLYVNVASGETCCLGDCVATSTD